MAVNTVKGEVQFQALGQSWTFQLDFNALCTIEPVIPGIMQGAVDIRLPSQVRTLFAAGLAKNQPGVTELDAGDILTDLGIPRALEIVAESLKAAFGTGEVAASSSNPPHRTRKRGLGPAD